MKASTTTKTEKYVKYWEQETPEIFTTEKNEVRIYPVHGKVQVYPIVQTSSRGIGKGGSINLDTFTKTELQAFKYQLGELLEQSEVGFDDEKRYWEHAEAYTISTEKNEIRVYKEHGKLQVYPKIETGRGIGRGATLNLEGVDLENEIYPILEAITEVVDRFEGAPDFSEPTPPPAEPVNVAEEQPKQQQPVNVMAEQPKAEPANDKMAKIEKLLAIFGGDESKLNKLLELLGDDETPAVPEAQVQEEPKQLTNARFEVSDSVKEAYKMFAAMTEAENIKYGFDKVFRKWEFKNARKMYEEQGTKTEALKYLKKALASGLAGFSTAGFSYDTNGKGVFFENGDGRKWSFTVAEAFNRYLGVYEFFEKEEEIKEITPPPSTEVEFDEEMEEFEELEEGGLEEDNTSDDEEMEAFEEEEITTSQPAVAVPVISDENTEDYSVYAKKLGDTELRKEYDNSTNIEASIYNPELTVALFEELKKRKING